jgi:hypothetical protein
VSERSFSRTVVAFDDEALAEVMKEEQTETKVDAVNRTSGEVADRRARRLRRVFDIWDEMATNIGETDWDEACRRPVAHPAKGAAACSLTRSSSAGPTASSGTALWNRLQRTLQPEAPAPHRCWIDRSGRGSTVPVRNRPFATPARSPWFRVQQLRASG